MPRKSAKPWRVMVPREFFNSKDVPLSDRAKVVFLALDWYARKRAFCYPSNAELQAATGKSVRTLQEILDELDAAGVTVRVLGDGPKPARVGFLMLRRVDPDSPAATTDEGIRQAEADLRAAASGRRGSGPRPAREKPSVEHADVRTLSVRDPACSSVRDPAPELESSRKDELKETNSRTESGTEFNPVSTRLQAAEPEPTPIAPVHTAQGPPKRSLTWEERQAIKRAGKAAPRPRQEAPPAGPVPASATPEPEPPTAPPDASQEWTADEQAWIETIPATKRAYFDAACPTIRRRAVDHRDTIGLTSNWKPLPPRPAADASVEDLVEAAAKDFSPGLMQETAAAIQGAFSDTPESIYLHMKQMQEVQERQRSPESITIPFRKALDRVAKGGIRNPAAYYNACVTNYREPALACR